MTGKFHSSLRILHFGVLTILLSALNSQLSTINAQSYSIDWYKVSGGGGTSTGGVYSVSGTVGQHDAGGPMSGGVYSVTGGFWSIYAVQSPGVPMLYITRSGPSSAMVWWIPGSGTYTLQTNSTLTVAGAWVNFAGTINSSGGTNSVTISPPTGTVYFRLKQ